MVDRISREGFWAGENLITPLTYMLKEGELKALKNQDSESSNNGSGEENC